MIFTLKSYICAILKYKYTATSRIHIAHSAKPSESHFNLASDSRESSYLAFGGNAIYYVDVNGDNAGEYFLRKDDGSYEYLGSDGNTDDKNAYVVNSYERDSNGIIVYADVNSKNTTDLGSKGNLISTSAIVHAEVYGNSTRNERLGIANAINNNRIAYNDRNGGDVSLAGRAPSRSS